MQNKVENVLKNGYNILFFLILVFRILLSDAIQLNYEFVNTICKYGFIAVSSLMSICLIHKIIEYKFTYKQIYILMIVFIVSMVGIIAKNTRILFMCFVVIISFFISTRRIMNVYFASSIFMLLFIFLSQNIGLINEINKNTEGFFLFMTSIFLFFRMQTKNIKATFLLRWLCLLLGIYLEYLIHDRTAEYLLLFFAIIYLFKLLQRRNAIIKSMIVVLPIILTVLSIYLAKNYSNYSWISTTLNNALSYRISIWNNLWNFYKVNLLPQDIMQYSYGFSFVMNTNISATDGFFAIGILEYGAIVYFVYIAAICIFLAKYYLGDNENPELIYCVILLILYGFTETIIDNGYLCFVIPISFSYLARMSLISRR